MFSLGRRKMMKKLLALMLVLGISSVAGAALTLDVGLREMDIGDTQAIGVAGDGATDPPLTVYLMVEGPASIDGGTNQYPGGGLEGYDDAEVLAAGLGVSVPELIAQFAEFVAMPDLSDVSMITLAAGAIPMPALEGTLVSDITLTGNAEGLATLTLLGDDFATVYDSVDVTVIPEPVTIALLGLGGLFLRRRR
jgi:hypothetical protein